MSREFGLNIERVLENWTVAHALREVIANALDEQALTKHQRAGDPPGRYRRWHVRDWGRGLRYEHLLLGDRACISPPGDDVAAIGCSRRCGSHWMGGSDPILRRAFPAPTSGANGG